MTPQEATDRLREAGLRARLLDNGSILGGSHVDRSTCINVVHDAFIIEPDPEGVTVRFGEAQGEPMTLEDAVALVLRNVAPKPDVEPVPRVPSRGPVLY